MCSINERKFSRAYIGTFSSSEARRSGRWATHFHVPAFDDIGRVRRYREIKDTGQWTRLLTVSNGTKRVIDYLYSVTIQREIRRKSAIASLLACE